MINIENQTDQDLGRFGTQGSGIQQILEEKNKNKQKQPETAVTIKPL